MNDLSFFTLSVANSPIQQLATITSNWDWIHPRVLITNPTSIFLHSALAAFTSNSSGINNVKLTQVTFSFKLGGRPFISAHFALDIDSLCWLSGLLSSATRPPYYSSLQCPTGCLWYGFLFLPWSHFPKLPVQLVDFPPVRFCPAVLRWAKVIPLPR